eukprot:24903-Pelagococcus_subviridis.AAC.1
MPHTPSSLTSKSHGLRASSSSSPPPPTLRGRCGEKTTAARLLIPLVGYEPSTVAPPPPLDRDKNSRVLTQFAHSNPNDGATRRPLVSTSPDGPKSRRCRDAAREKSPPPPLRLLPPPPISSSSLTTSLTWFVTTTARSCLCAYSFKSAAARDNVPDRATTPSTVLVSLSRNGDAIESITTRRTGRAAPPGGSLSTPAIDASAHHSPSGSSSVFTTYT